MRAIRLASVIVVFACMTAVQAVLRKGQNEETGTEIIAINDEYDAIPGQRSNGGRLQTKTISRNNMEGMQSPMVSSDESNDGWERLAGTLADRQRKVQSASGELHQPDDSLYHCPLPSYIMAALIAVVYTILLISSHNIWTERGMAFQKNCIEHLTRGTFALPADEPLPGTEYLNKLIPTAHHYRAFLNEKYPLLTVSLLMEECEAKAAASFEISACDCLKEHECFDARSFSSMTLGYEYALQLASADGNLELVEYIEGRGCVDLSKGRKHALQLAAKYGQDKVVLHYVNSGVDVHADGDIALLFAAESGHHAVTQVLLGSYIFDTKALNDALYVASKNGRVAVIQQILSIDSFFTLDTVQAHAIAVANGHTDAAQILLEHEEITTVENEN